MNVPDANDNLPWSVNDRFHGVEARLLQLLAVHGRYSMLLQNLDKEWTELFIILNLLCSSLWLLHCGSHNCLDK